MSKDTLRSLTVGAKKEFASDTVEYAGETFEVRQPSLKQRNNLLTRCRDGKGEIDPTALMVWITIHCVYDPETGEPVFDEADYEAMTESPPNGFVDVLGAKALEVAGLSGNDEEATES